MKNKVVNYNEILNFYKGKRVLIFGNTGFKGAWLTYILLVAGAEVIGYALRPESGLSLFNLIKLECKEHLIQIYADVRDFNKVKKVIGDLKPQIVIHLAAQAIVRKSYKDPIETYSTNVMGTVNICEAIRISRNASGEHYVHSFLNVTTDKVYKNNEWEWGYRETDFIDGLDPYSNSKSCSELVTHSYKNCFFEDGSVRISTVRAGNVIGGGDFSIDRIIPDCVRAVFNDEVINVRNPYSIRPYEHLLEPLFAYLMIVKVQYEDEKYAGYYNVGPDDRDCVTTGDLVSLFCDEWNKGGLGANASWANVAEKDDPHEANFLKLDCSKLKNTFHWAPRWHIEDAVRKTVDWTRVWMDYGDAFAIRSEMDREIEEFVSLT